MSSMPRGVCLIINNMKFDQPRRGSEKDEGSFIRFIPSECQCCPSLLITLLIHLKFIQNHFLLRKIKQINKNKQQQHNQSHQMALWWWDREISISP